MEKEDERYKYAKKKVEELRGFYVHVLIYIVVNIGLFLMNLIQTPGAWWFYWATIGWGIGLAAHAVSVFTHYGVFGKDWEEKKIKEEMEKKP